MKELYQILEWIEDLSHVPGDNIDKTQKLINNMLNTSVFGVWTIQDVKSIMQYKDMPIPSDAKCFEILYYCCDQFGSYKGCNEASIEYSIQTYIEGGFDG